MNSHRILLLVWILCLTGFSAARGADELLKVHEWGTFTSFQDERGAAFAKINTDDEPVPKFVHQLFYNGQFAPTNMPPRGSQGAERAHPSVTMRLETPVTYFHLPKSRQEMTLDVSVEFQGGWLTEFFPNAATQVNGRMVKDCKEEALDPSTVGRLSWKGLRLGGNGEGPATAERVWLAPRNVRAAQVTVGEESERFLFYRGVGHRDAPLRIVRQPADHQLQLRSPLKESPALTRSGMKLSHLWLAEVAPDGTSAFRSLPDITLDGRPDQFLGETPGTFSATEFRAENLGKLRAAMQAALVVQGLFDDEAAALLNTWELSYFQSPGLRMFFLLPQTWTDHVLPLKMSVPADVTRVMVGRIELVTPRQRKLIQKIASMPLVNLKEVSNAMWKLRGSLSAADCEKYNALASGRGNPADLGVPVPENYKAFLDLGRFRTSLLLSATWTGKRLNRALNDFAFEVELPGYGYEKYQREQRERDNQQKKHRESLERQIQTIQQQDKQQPPRTNAVLFLGDSSIEQWDLAKSFPNQIVIRRGFRKLLVADLASFAIRIVTPYQPRLIVVQAGAMDIVSGASADQVFSDYRAFVTDVHDKLPKTQIVFIAVKPSPSHWEYFDAQGDANRLIQEFAQRDDRLSFVDVVKPMLGSDGRPRPELFRENNFFLSEKGYTLWTELLAPVLQGNSLRTSTAP